jgi:hypothetical protein
VKLLPRRKRKTETALAATGPVTVDPSLPHEHPAPTEPAITWVRWWREAHGPRPGQYTKWHARTPQWGLRCMPLKAQQHDETVSPVTPPETDMCARCRGHLLAGHLSDTPASSPGGGG